MGGETGAGAAKVVPWWSAALFLRLALAAAPRWRRRACPGAGCKGGGAVSEGEDTISSLSLVLPSEVVAVRVACQLNTNWEANIFNRLACFEPTKYTHILN